MYVYMSVYIYIYIDVHKNKYMYMYIFILPQIDRYSNFKNKEFKSIKQYICKQWQDKYLKAIFKLESLDLP